MSGRALRRDHLSLYGYERTTSPFIDALAAEGLVIDDAIAQASATLRSAAAFMTGLYPLPAFTPHALRRTYMVICSTGYSCYG